MYELTDADLTALSQEDNTSAYIFGTLSLAVSTCSFGVSNAASGEWFGAFIAAGILGSIFAGFFFIQAFSKRISLLRRIDKIRGVSSGNRLRLRLPWTFD